VPRLERALEEGLEALNGRRNLQEVLRRHPEDRDELISLLRLSIDVGRLPQPAPDPAFRLRARNRMLASAQERRRRRRPALVSALRPALAAAAVLVALTGGMTVAASNSLPGEPLYGVKIGLEQVRLTATFNPADRARLRLNLADRRLDEAQRLVALGRVEDAVTAVDHYDQDVSEFDQALSPQALTQQEAGVIERLLGDRQLSSTRRLQSLAGSLTAQGKPQAAAAVSHATTRATQTLGNSKKRLEVQTEPSRPGSPAGQSGQNPPPPRWSPPPANR
jgi:hypothetical protein